MRRNIRRWYRSPAAITTCCACGPRPEVKRAWIQIHLWLGLTLGVLGIFIGLSGSVLVYDHEIDAWLNPQRYAVSGPKAALPYGEYLKNAAQALDGRARPVNLRLPEDEGMPVVVLARTRWWWLYPP